MRTRVGPSQLEGREFNREGGRGDRSEGEFSPSSASGAMMISRLMDVAAA